jgi:hypothetical protein
VAYYYLVASLPSVSLEAKPPVSREDFLRSCRGVLSEADFRDMSLVLEGRESEAAHPSVRRWRDRETQLRNAVARIRAVKAGADPTPFQRSHGGFDVSVEQGVAEALGRPNPLEREQALDRLRWRLAEELALEGPFDMPAVFAFVIKLRLAERWHGWDQDKGREAFEALVARTMQGTNHG